MNKSIEQAKVAELVRLLRDANVNYYTKKIIFMQDNPVELVKIVINPLIKALQDIATLSMGDSVKGLTAQIIAENAIRAHYDKSKEL